MATHSSILLWRIPGKSWILVGYSPWGGKELDRIEVTYHTHTFINMCNMPKKRVGNIYLFLILRRRRGIRESILDSLYSLFHLRILPAGQGGKKADASTIQECLISGLCTFFP